MPKRKFWFLFTLILVLAIFLRFYRLGDIPYALYWDEIAMLVDARSVAETGLDMHGNHWFQAIFPSYGDYKLPVYIWLASLSFKIFGASEWALRLPSALAGLGTIFVTIGIILELFPKLKQEKKRWLALFSALVLAISPWAIMFSRTAFEGHVGQFLVASSVLLLFKAKSLKKPWLFLPAVLLGSLATYAYFSVRFVWPVIFLAFFILFGDWKKKKAIFNQIGFLIIGLIIYFASLYPMSQSVHYAASNQFRLSTTSVLNMEDWAVQSNIYREQAGNKFIDRAIYHRHVLMIKELAKNYSDNLSLNFLFFKGDPNLRHGTTQHGLFLWIFLPAVLIGFYRFTKDKPKALTFLIIWWILALLPASVPEGTPHALRSLNALVPMALVIAYGCYVSLIWLLNLNKKWLKMALGSGTLILLAILVFEFANFYFNIYPDLSSPEWQDGYKELAEFTWDQYEEGGLDVIWIDPFDGRFHLWLMGYGMPVEMYHQLEYEDFGLKIIGEENQELEIRFRWFDWKKLPTLSQKVLVVARRDYIDDELESVPYLPTWYEVIETKAGEREFAVVRFER